MRCTERETVRKQRRHLLTTGAFLLYTTLNSSLCQSRVFKYTPPSAPIDALTLDRIIDKYTRMMYDDTEKSIGFEKAMQELERRFGITWQEM